MRPIVIELNGHLMYGNNIYPVLLHDLSVTTRLHHLHFNNLTDTLIQSDLLLVSLLITFVSGVISLPYAEIKEPFEAWFDLKGRTSRIDYYHGNYLHTSCTIVKQYGSVFSQASWNIHLIAYVNKILADF